MWGCIVDSKRNVQLFGRTALIYAAAYGRTEVVRLLLDRGADHTLRNVVGHCLRVTVVVCTCM